MILVALVLAAGAVVMARSWISGQIADRAPADTPEITTTTVVVAAAPLRFGNKLEREHVKIVEWPAGLVPEGTFTTIEEIISDEEPRVVLQSIEVNEPILVTKITGPGQRASLSTIISAGMRAMTIRVNDVLGVAGFVLPNDRVDLLLTREIIKNQPITDVLLQNIKVLGIDQKADQPDDGAADVVKSVTIEVTVEQAQKITLASTVGTLSLALRDVENVASEATRTISLRDLNIGEANVVPAPVIAELDDDGDADALAPPPTPAPTPTAVVLEPAEEFGSIGITRGTARQEYRVNGTGQVMP